ncbi:MAG: hypothetical protein R2880_13610 [Deinococcales bacterium]
MPSVEDIINQYGPAQHLSLAELEAGLAKVHASPKDGGALELIVRRSAENMREAIDEANLDLELGLVGDSWKNRPSTRSADGLAHPDMQLNIMNARFIDLISQDRARWPLAGDQLFLDMDLSAANLPAGSQLALGSAIIEVTDQPHTGCQKFVARFGLDAMKFVNSKLGRELNLRGINAKVIQAGQIHLGDIAKKL